METWVGCSFAPPSFAVNANLKKELRGFSKQAAALKMFESKAQG